MTFHVHVRIMPRAGLLDPAGQAVEHALSALGFSEASEVHLGRAIELTIESASEAEATERARAMCERLLANPVTEDYTIEVSA
ncbi:MAG TPA: phosphoribosylformylglycinamidine synthase subunit PurS [Gemmatimonadales bacterium]|nr:phosphoribosylformylglycinamidine synthase subunit PurS [Gemmatimonadales bacterium]